jgi:hypothetical protein
MEIGNSDQEAMARFWERIVDAPRDPHERLDDNDGEDRADCTECDKKEVTWQLCEGDDCDKKLCNISFQPDFPGSPPFVQVIRPRFQQWTGHVTIGGSMCTELLTGSGWKPDISAMGLMLQLQNNLVEGGAKVDTYNVHDYTKVEALEAFKRVARDHGWKIPSSLK